LLFDATLSAQSDASLLPVCDFILKPADSARSERDWRRKCAICDALVNCTTLFAGDRLHYGQANDAAKMTFLISVGFSPSVAPQHFGNGHV
jgi:hypothetical protein